MKESSGANVHTKRREARAAFGSAQEWIAWLRPPFPRLTRARANAPLTEADVQDWSEVVEEFDPSDCSYNPKQPVRWVKAHKDEVIIHERVQRNATPQLLSITWSAQGGSGVSTWSSCSN